MVTDTIGDFLTRIRNAQQRGKNEISLPSSNMLTAVSKVLKEEGFIKDFSEDKSEKDSPQKSLNITLRYLKKKEPAIKGIKRISKPGVRIYTGYRDIPKVLSGIGVVILTTPKGVMTGYKAKKEKLGGEVLCKIW